MAGFGAAFQLPEDFAQRYNQLIPGNVAFLELNPELEGFVRRLKLKDERPGSLWSGLFLPALTARFIPRQSALQDAVKHLDHLLFG